MLLSGELSIPVTISVQGVAHVLPNIQSAALEAKIDVF
jgi:hypothetical protein